jgi:hypothetical protein
MRENAIRRYERENRPYGADPKIVAAYAAFFMRVKWQLFCTFTFGSRLATFGSQLSDEEANRRFAEFINLLEHWYKADIVYIRGDEKRFSGCGKPGSPRHFHAVMTSAAPLHPPVVASLWTHMVGNWDDGADVQSYDADRNGIGYVLKKMDQQHGDWTFYKLHLVLPVNVKDLNRQKRRNLRRHEARKKYLASKSNSLAAMLEGSGWAVVHEPVDEALAQQL